MHGHHMGHGSSGGCCRQQAVLKVGEPAPHFAGEALIDGEFKKISLEDYRGKWVVLFFYPLDFTFVCPTEITGFHKHLAEFDKLGAVIIGCSTDSVHSHKAWTEGSLGKIDYPLLGDTTHRISKDYDVLIKEQGIALRGTFIIDQDGILRYQVISDLNVGRSVAETLRVIKALQTGELCPVEWGEGEKTLGKA